MSLSQEPAFPVLKNYFVCGVKDISRAPYAGASRRHAADGQAIRTTNGAGPHNIQLFVLAPDGTVLHCLPGYWHPRDLLMELELAADLYDVWRDPHLTRQQKDALFRKLQLAHLDQHPPDMVMRSRMQGFDQKYEARHRLYTSDTIKNPQLIVMSYPTMGAGMLPQEAFKTTDEIVHERMAARPFVNYEQFDTARYADYGRPFYDKHEDQRDLSGQRVAFDERRDQLIGNVPNKPGRRGPMRRGFAGYLMQRGLKYFGNYGVAAMR